MLLLLSFRVSFPGVLPRLPPQGAEERVPVKGAGGKAGDLLDGSAEAQAEAREDPADLPVGIGTVAGDDQGGQAVYHEPQVAEIEIGFPRNELSRTFLQNKKLSTTLFFGYRKLVLYMYLYIIILQYASYGDSHNLTNRDIILTGKSQKRKLMLSKLRYH